MLVVSATDSSNSVASFSTYGGFITLAAPGVGIYTTARGGGYGSVSGTSFSSPIVAGAAALVLSRRPDFSPSQVDSTLKSTATDLKKSFSQEAMADAPIDAGVVIFQLIGLKNVKAGAALDKHGAALFQKEVEKEKKIAEKVFEVERRYLIRTRG